MQKNVDGRGEIINHIVLVSIYISKHQAPFISILATTVLPLVSGLTQNEVAREGDSFCSSTGFSSSFP